MLTLTDQRHIGRKVSNFTISINRLREGLGLSASRMTVRRAIRRNPNIVRQTMKQAPHFLQYHQDERLYVVRRNVVTDWNKVRFELFCHFSKFFFKSFGVTRKSSILMDPAMEETLSHQLS